MSSTGQSPFLFNRQKKWPEATWPYTLFWTFFVCFIKIPWSSKCCWTSNLKCPLKNDIQGWKDTSRQTTNLAMSAITLEHVIQYFFKIYLAMSWNKSWCNSIIQSVISLPNINCHKSNMRVCLPAGSPERWRPGTGRIWQWWCVSGCSRRAMSDSRHLHPSSHQQAAEPESSLPLHGLNWPPPEIWLRTDQDLRWRKKQRKIITR